jgi:XTP/dITP diphosphohydrolase
MKEKIILATRNPTKLVQIQALFTGSPFEIVSLDQAGIKGDAVEDGGTLKENAFKKARFAFEHNSHDTWAMADDTGLFIDALNGEPGIRSARWLGDSASTEDTSRYCLDRLNGISNRLATFETAVVVIDPCGDDYSFSGKVRGHILEKPKVKPQPKMPYSCLFVPDGSDTSWAEMTTEAENLISHRGKAFREARTWLESVIKNY